MFSRLFKSARSIVSPTPPDEPEPAPPTSWKPIEVPKATPAKKTKSPRVKASIEKATPEPNFEKHTHFSAELALSTPKGSKVKQPQITVTNPTPHRTRVHSPDMVITRAQQELEAGDLTDENSINVHIPGTVSTRKSASRKRNANSIDSVMAEGTPSRSAKKRKVAALPVRKKAIVDDSDDENQEELGLSIIDEIKVKSTPVVEIRVNKALEKEVQNGGSAKKHKKFGSDDEQEEEEHRFSTARESQDVEEEEESSSDDDAPEEVGAQIAVQKVKAQAESTKLAIQSQKQKRKERASKAQAQPKKMRKPSIEPELDDVEDDDVDSSEENQVIGEMDELDDSNESEIEDLDSALAQPRRINYVALDKPIKDRTIGQTTYKVNRSQSKTLAPRINKDSRNKKEIFLHARGPKPGANRGQAKKNFF